MKKTITGSLVVLTLSVNAQIKVFTGGSVTIGATTAPYGVSHQVVCDKMAFSASTSAITSAPLIVGQNSASTSPGFTFWGDHQTGIAHPASSILGITIANAEKFRFNSVGQILSSATQATATPAYSWTVDPNTGLYNPAADMIGFVTNGTEKFRMNSSGQLLNNNTTSSASAPDYSWTGSTNTGIFHSGSTFIGFSIGGTEIYRIISNGQILSAKVTGSASTPDYSWSNDPGTGMYLAGTNLIGLSINASEKFRINSSGQLLNANTTGSASTPDYSWSGDVNTGIYHPATDVLGFVTNGNERMRVSSTGRLMIGTTSVSTGLLNTVSTDATGGYFKATYSSDYGPPIIEAETDRSNSVTYRGTLTGTGTTYYVAGAGWIYSQGNYLGSDRNIKDEIKTIDSASTKINKITGVTYKLIKEKQNPSVYGTANEYMGVIAQDVEAVAPQAVKNLPDGTKAVCYEMLVGLLIEGFKEQSAKVDKLQSDLNNCCSKPTDGKTNRTIQNNDGNTSNEDTQSYMKQNRPNPFNKETVIEYNIVESGNASILVFDMNGKLLKTIPVKIPGKGSVTINANDFSAGMYYYSLVVNDTEVDTKKMILTE